MAFLVEHHPDVFTENLKPQFQMRINSFPSDSSSLNSTYSSVNSLQGCGENAYNLQLPSNRIDMHQISNAASHNIISNNALNINKLRKNLSQLITSAPHHGPHDGSSHFFPNGSTCEGFQNDGDPECYNLSGSTGHSYSPGYVIEEPVQVRLIVLFLFVCLLVCLFVISYIMLFLTFRWLLFVGTSFVSCFFLISLVVHFFLYHISCYLGRLLYVSSLSK